MFAGRITQLSPTLLNVLSQAIGWERLREDRQAFSDLCRAVSTLSELFTRGGLTSKPDYLTDSSLRQAYQSYFLPVNLAKLQVLLDEMPALQTDGDCLRVLDLGGGPGTGILAVADWLCQSNLGLSCLIEAVDRRAALSEAQRLCEQYCATETKPHVALSLVEGDLEKSNWIRKIATPRYDLILVANVLNELYIDSKHRVERRAEWMTTVLDRLAPHGTLIVLEPALRPIARDLHSVRDRLLRLGLASVYSPCLHRQSCPALVNPDDWCHEERPWIRPPWITVIDRAVGFIKDALKFSYLILRKDGRRIVPNEKDVYRVVSELRRLKGDTRAWLCHESGRPEIGRLDRARSAANAAFDAWHRGAIVRVQDIEWKKTPTDRRLGRIGSTSQVEVIRVAR